MSKLYVTVKTDAIRTVHTARAHNWAKAVFQSWEGSVQLRIDSSGCVELYAESGSVPNPAFCVARWTLDELLHLTPLTAG